MVVYQRTLLLMLKTGLWRRKPDISSRRIHACGRQFSLAGRNLDFFVMSLLLRAQFLRPWDVPQLWSWYRCPR